MKTLSDMTMTEAVSKAFEILIRKEYDSAVKGSKYSAPYEGTFEEFLQSNYLDEYGDEDDVFEYDSQYVWEDRMGEGIEYTVDGWTANVPATYGGEGEGENYWMVISLSDGTTTRYFRRDGWYASYDGGYLDGETYEVSPVERMVTYYE